MQKIINLPKDISKYLEKEAEFLNISLETLIVLYLTERVNELKAHIDNIEQSSHPQEKKLGKVLLFPSTEK
jgi:hypothetical protein